MSDSVVVPYATTMKILGGCLIFFSIVEFAIGGAVYGYLTNVHLGAWWGAICCFIAGVCGVITNGRSAVIAGLVFSIFAIIISIVGTIVDGLSAAVFSSEKGCANAETGELWGTSEAKANAYFCAQPYRYYFSNYNTNWSGYQCVCTDNSSCFGYDLASGSNCGDILTVYTPLLSTSTAILALLVVLSFIYSVFTCMTCGQSNYAAPPAAAGAPPALQMTQPAGQQAVQYVPVPVVAGQAVHA